MPIASSSLTIADLNDGITISSSPTSIQLPSKDGLTPILTGNSISLSVKNKSVDESSGWKFYVQAIAAGVSYRDTVNTVSRNGTGRTAGALSSRTLVVTACPAGAQTAYITVRAYKRKALELELSLPISISAGGVSGAVATPVYTAMLSSSSQTLKASADGTVSSYAPATTSVSVYRGNVDDTSNWTFEKSDGSGVVSSISGETLSVSSLTTDTGKVTITGSRTDPVNLLKPVAWTLINVTQVYSTSQVAPSGAKTAYTIREAPPDATNDYPRYLRVSARDGVTMNSTLTASAYLKAGTRTTVGLKLSDPAHSTYGLVIVNLLTGEINYDSSVGGFVPVGYTCEALPNGWWRVALTGRKPGGGTDAAILVYSTDESGDTTISGTNSYFFAWGLQIDASGGAAYSPLAGDVSIVYTVSKATAGNDSKALILSASSQVFSIAGDSTVSPSIITFTAGLKNISGTPSFSVQNGSASLTTSGTTATLTYEDMATDSVTVKATLGGYSDTVTVAKVSSAIAEPSYNIVASNQAHTVAADSAGNVTSFSGAINTISIYRNGVDDTSNWVLTHADTNVTASITGSTVTVSAMTASSTSGRVDITAKRTDPVNIFSADKSEDFGAWAMTRCTVTRATQVDDPFKGGDAWNMKEDASLATSHYLAANTPFVGGNSYTISVFVKSGGRNCFRILSSSPGNVYVTYDVRGGGSVVPGYSSGAVASGITSCGGGWYRVWMVLDVSVTTSTGNVTLVSCADTGTSILDGDTTKGWRLFGFNITSSSVLLPYQHVAPTLTSRFSISKAKAGADGADGASGSRGTVQLSRAITGTAWSNTEASLAISSAGYGSPILGDVVTLYKTSASYSESRTWTGSAWIAMAAWINGNMLVSGTIVAENLAVNSITTEKIVVGSIVNNYSSTASTGGSGTMTQNLTSPTCSVNVLTKALGGYAATIDVFFNAGFGDHTTSAYSFADGDSVLVTFHPTISGGGWYGSVAPIVDQRVTLAMMRCGTTANRNKGYFSGQLSLRAYKWDAATYNIGIMFVAEIRDSAGNLKSGLTPYYNITAYCNVSEYKV